MSTMDHFFYSTMPIKVDRPSFHSHNSPYTCFIASQLIAAQDYTLEF